MAKSLAKVQKKIIKKRGNINSLLENSRDSQKLRRASARAVKLKRVSTARAKANEPYLERLAFFQEAAKITTDAIEIDSIQSLIQIFLNRHDDELSELQNDRRPGRPSSSREDSLKQHKVTESREYTAGFWLPDIEDEETLRLLNVWNGRWTSLGLLKYIRVTRNGVKNSSSFPPKGQS